MEKQLDSYLNVMENKSYINEKKNNNPREYIYSSAEELSSVIENVENKNGV